MQIEREFAPLKNAAYIAAQRLSQRFWGARGKTTQRGRKCSTTNWSL